MKWIYGRQEFKTVERSEETCYLMTNGLGGFSSLTAAGAAARNDHAFFMACVKSPNSRYNIIHRLREQVGDRVLSTQEMADGPGEAGCRYLSSFTWEDPRLAVPGGWWGDPQGGGHGAGGEHHCPAL